MFTSLQVQSTHSLRWRTLVL